MVLYHAKVYTIDNLFSSLYINVGNCEEIVRQYMMNESSTVGEGKDECIDYNWHI